MAPRIRALSAREFALRDKLEGLHAHYHRPEFLTADPLMTAHRYPAAEDREVVALIAAAFASGNIRAIIAALDGILGVMGDSPAAWLRANDPAAIAGRFGGHQHRWAKPEDIERLLARIGAALRAYGSLGGLWQFVDNRDEPTVGPALGRFTAALLELSVAPLPQRPREIIRADGRITSLAPVESILLTSPAGGSACKRMNLFLRWVVRPADGIDLGLWTRFVSPARLLMPVDVHVLRISRELRLTRRRLPDWKAAEEITARLRRLCPEDPCRYDFSFVRLGQERRAAGG